MDLSAILNQSAADKAAAGSVQQQASSPSSSNTAVRPPTRSTSLAQPLSPYQHSIQASHHSPSQIQHQFQPQQYSQQQHSSSSQIVRHQSIPSYPLAHPEGYAGPPHSQVLYAPLREEHLRDGSQSVSPKTQPNVLSRNASLDSYRSFDNAGLLDNRAVDAGSYSSVSRNHNREPSTQSIISNSPSHHPDPREHQHLSPHLTQNPSVTSSPVQSRPAEFQVPYLHQSPAEARSVPPFRLPSQSPQQVKTTSSPMLTKSMPPPTTPNQSHQTSPMIHQREMSAASDRSSPAVPKSMSRSTSVTNIIALPINAPAESTRKRSLGSTDQTLRPQKRTKHDQPPIWAQRSDWKHNSRIMDQWTPEPRVAVSRVASAADTSGLSAELLVNKRHTNGFDAQQPTRTNGSHASVSQPPAPKPDYEPSLDGFTPYNAITREIGGFVFSNLVMAPDLENTEFEIEAKLGKIIDPRSGARINNYCSTETILAEGHPYSFRSSMSIAQHRIMNQYLNIETQRSQRPDSTRQKIRYEHLRETDKQYQMPSDFWNSLSEMVRDVQSKQRRPPTLRVTTDQKTGQIKAAIFKLKVKDLEIFCPQEEFDVRISIACEIRFPLDRVHELKECVEKEGKGNTGSRFKDRLSYKHQFVSVDLTQVTNADGSKSSELELECDTKLLRDQGLRNDAGLDNKYEAVVEIFTNYIRVLNRTCPPQPQVIAQ